MPCLSFFFNSYFVYYWVPFINLCFQYMLTETGTIILFSIHFECQYQKKAAHTEGTAGGP